MSLALLPFGLLVFRSLPDRGYLLLKPLGLLVVSWLVWMGASLKLFHFTRGSIIAALVLVVLFGVALGWARRQELLTFVRQHWRGMLLSEALFLGAFLIFYWIRMVDPDLWHAYRGGEKPMDFAYLNAVTRSTTMPPYDPWFAGGYLNYYYFGQFMTATLIKLTGILPEIGFNLAVPMYFALTVGATYSVCFNLAEATRRRIRWRPGPAHISQTGTVLAGVLGAVLVAGVGNLHGLYQMANRFSKVSDWHVGHGIPLLSGLVGMLGGIWKATTEGGVKLPPFDYWAPSRMMPPQASITEFPFFTFLFADLHAHLMAIPFDIAILGVGLALVLARSGGRGEDAASGGQRATSWLGVVVLGLLIGALRPINSWDYPPFLLMGMAAILIGEWAIEGRLSWPVVGRAALKAAALTVLSVAFFLPFWQNYHLAYKGFQASKETTLFHQFLGHFGLLLFGAMTLVAVLAWRAVRRHRPWKVVPLYILTLISVLALVCVAMLLSDQTERLPITVKGLSASDFLRDLFTNHIPVIAFSLTVIAALLLLAWRELRDRRPDAPIRLFVFAMIGLALTISSGVDIVILSGSDRMNTVFKFYIHVWLLLAVAAAFGIWYMLAVIRRAPGATKPPRTAWEQIGVWQGVWVLALALLLVGSLIYTVSGTRARVSSSDRFDQYHGHSINGMEYMRYAVYREENGEIELKYDYDAIWWMRENVEGTPVIVEGQTPSYRWGSRFSIYTGLPTVIGWGWHQKQQRAGFDYMIDEREKELKEFYSSPSIDVAIIVGQVEQLYYPAEGIAKFAQMNGRELELVYENPKVQIYRVLSLPPLIPTGTPKS
jgi:YYY domain-containing protein